MNELRDKYGITNEKDISIVLELLIDKISLSYVLEYISAITLEKSEHVSSNYDDATLADNWQAASNLIDNVIEDIEV